MDRVAFAVEQRVADAKAGAGEEMGSRVVGLERESRRLVRFDADDDDRIAAVAVERSLGQRWSAAGRGEHAGEDRESHRSRAEHLGSFGR